MSSVIVTIDGPSGTGKSTVSREVARRAGLPHLDTGAYYRAATLAVLRSGVDLDSAAEVARVVREADLSERTDRMYLDGEDVSDEIRDVPVTVAVSQVSAYPEVRRRLVEHQRAWVEAHGSSAVVEGRDIGSVVFPQADIKIYLDASPEVRATRRARQLGHHDPSAVIDDLARRDQFDSNRRASPLKVPDDASVIDTSHLSFDQVVDEVLELIEAHS